MHVASYAKDLERWIPRLVSVWRKAQRRPGPAELTPAEVRDVGQGVKSLSLGLTRERELAGAKYMDDPRLLGAYLLFYWPVSYAQARQALGELPRRHRAVLDLGSGPGPLAFAAMDAGGMEVTAADRSRPALELARELAIQAEASLGTRHWDPLAKGDLPDGEFDLVSMGHILNELYAKDPAADAQRARLCEDALRRVKPGGSLLLIEPALRDTSRALLRVRDLLVARGYAVRAPCLWRGACPALVKETDWCHGERDWQMPRLVEQLARAAGLHKEALKMSYLAVAPRGEAWPEPPSGRPFRIVSEPLEGKGRRRYIGCGPEGRLGLALQDKHVNPGNEAFGRLNRGDVIAITETEPRGDGLALSDQSQVQVVARAGQALP